MVKVTEQQFYTAQENSIERVNNDNVLSSKVGKRLTKLTQQFIQTNKHTEGAVKITIKAFNLITFAKSWIQEKTKINEVIYWHLSRKMKKLIFFNKKKKNDLLMAKWVLLADRHTVD